LITRWKSSYNQGSYSSDKIVALGDSAVVGWTLFDVAIKPRLSLEYNYASGNAAKDGEPNTFDQFYPSNHNYYGMIDQFGWKNMKNERAGFDFLPLKKLKVRTDFNEFYLATVQDGLYNSSGTSVVLDRKATSAHIGPETNTVGLYQYSKVWKFGAGFRQLFAGEYLKESRVWVPTRTLCFLGTSRRRGLAPTLKRPARVSYFMNRWVR
jgi:hypothetical protein